MLVACQLLRAMALLWDIKFPGGIFADDEVGPRISPSTLMDRMNEAHMLTEMTKSNDMPISNPLCARRGDMFVAAKPMTSSPRQASIPARADLNAARRYAR